MKPVLRLFSSLTAFERTLWLVSLAATALSAWAAGSFDLQTVASLIGVTALIFVAKGYVIGQVLTIVFAVFYGVISYGLRYYGEMITYLGMTTPMALAAVVSWIRHPYQGSKEVEVHRLTPGQRFFLLLSSVAVTILFYWILRALGNAELLISTLSVTTSYLASALTFFRSPAYALCYAANDVVLIILWTIASLAAPACFPMIVCFVMFLANDVYGYVNWRRMQRRQHAG